MSESRNPYYLSTAIPYVNAEPHLGYALEQVLGDSLSRYQRLRGRSVWFQTGTDENSLKNVQAAERERVTTRALVERHAARYVALRDALASPWRTPSHTPWRTRA